jgi:hypothetical protein
LEPDEDVSPSDSTAVKNIKILGKPVLTKEEFFATQTKPTRKGSFWFSPLSLTLFIILIFAVGFGAYAYFIKDTESVENTPPVSEPFMSPEDRAREEALQTVKSAGKVIRLPEDEEPNIATVVDLAPLKGQAFFEHAALGDKALVYTKNGKAFLYRPSENKIIEVGSFDPLNSGSSVQVLGSEPEAKTIQVEIRNGSGVSGAGAKTKNKLLEKDGFIVTSVGNALLTSYTHTLIIDLKPSVNSSVVEKLSTLLGASVLTIMPEGEKPTTADVLVIVGKN